MPRLPPESKRLVNFKPSNTASGPQNPIKLLKLLADAKHLKNGTTIHAHFIIADQTSKNNIVEVNSLVNLYAKCGEIMAARKLFDNMSHRNVISWSALMAGYLHNGLSLEVISLFKDMISKNDVSPNEYIFATVLSSCSDSGLVKEGIQCHGLALKSGLEFHQYVKNALIHMYSRSYRVQEAMWICDSLPRSDIFAYNSLMLGLIENGCLMECLEVLRKMVNKNVKWDNVTYVHVFGLCACLKDLRFGLQVHGNMLMSNVECDMHVNSALINMYGRCGDASNAGKVFDSLQNRNVVLWTAIITAYFHNGWFEEALDLFAKMKLEDGKPNEITFAVLLNASAGLSALRHGCLLHACIEKSGFKDHISVGNALINMYAKGGIIESAYTIFTGMTFRDAITWNAMICGYSHHGLGNDALQVFHEMLAAEEHPNYVTFVGILSACSHLGMVQQGMYYLKHLMKQNSIEPGLEHYTCIIGLLSRAGRLHDAWNFMKSLAVKWDIVAWRTLLNGCHVHQNYDLGRHVAKIVLQMDPIDVGTYTLLSNMYARAKRWDGVVKMRKLMRNINIKKEPGVSWIEIRNVTHIFLSEDFKHPDYSQIYEKIKELLAMIKPLGYVPNNGSVLHDIEEEQKDDYLCYHSEKLAIAYGLMKMPSRSPIIVIKNLRMCEDCHAAVKLISKVTNKNIIVRDTNRFHHFWDGCCSCADYW